jgi:hypothetical protein
MNKPKNDAKLIPLESVRISRLILPTTKLPVVSRAVDQYLLQLGIQAALVKIDGKGQELRHVTPEQADELEKLFKQKHWRKFQAAEGK